MLKPAVVMALLTLLSAAPGRAQMLPSRGERVRVTEHSGSKTVGIVDSMTADSMHVRRAVDGVESKIAIAREGIARIEVSDGNTQQVRKAVKVGAIVVPAALAVGGLIAGLSADSGEEGIPAWWGGVEGVAALVGVGAALGAVLGVIVGPFIVTERWVPVTARSAQHDQTQPPRTPLAAGLLELSVPTTGYLYAGDPAKGRIPNALRVGGMVMYLAALIDTGAKPCEFECVWGKRAVAVGTVWATAGAVRLASERGERREAPALAVMLLPSQRGEVSLVFHWAR